jgi:hypothetical protein
MITGEARGEVRGEVLGWAISPTSPQWTNGLYHATIAVCAGMKGGVSSPMIELSTIAFLLVAAAEIPCVQFLCFTPVVNIFLVNTVYPDKERLVALLHVHPVSLEARHRFSTSASPHLLLLTS